MFLDGRVAEWMRRHGVSSNLSSDIVGTKWVNLFNHSFLISMKYYGRVSEWLNAVPSKSSMPERVSRVRIPPLPLCKNKPMTKISTGTVHKIPRDLRKYLEASPKALIAWNDITPLARNVWICWVISVKKPETRKNHIERVRIELSEGKRRPCCWPGCPHRKK